MRKESNCDMNAWKNPVVKTSEDSYGLNCIALKIYVKVLTATSWDWLFGPLKRCIGPNPVSQVSLHEEICVDTDMGCYLTHSQQGHI